MNGLSGLHTHLVIAYSGCDQDVGEAALGAGGPNGLVASNNGYDWLGTGIYFWEADPDRARRWAEDSHRRQVKRHREQGTPIRIRRPFVVGALLNLGNCLDLTTSGGVSLLQEYYPLYIEDTKELGLNLPENTKDQDRKGRYLDNAVINYACGLYSRTKKIPIDTVRSIFMEGGEAYPGSAFQEKTHTQICVREPHRAVVAYFRASNGSEP